MAGEAVKLTVAVPEALVFRAAQAGFAPTEFVETVLSTLSPDEWIARLAGRTREAPASPASATGTNWTRDSFFDFLESVGRLPRGVEMTFLLAAYSDLGQRPLSGALQEHCGFEKSMRGNAIWHQEFRAAKARLTIMARRRREGALFLQASASGGDRAHPMDPKLHAWLCEWFAGPARGRFPPPSRWGGLDSLLEKYASLDVAAPTAGAGSANR